MTGFTEAEYVEAIAMSDERFDAFVRATLADDIEIALDALAATGLFAVRVREDGQKEIMKLDAATDGLLEALQARAVAEGRIR